MFDRLYAQPRGGPGRWHNPSMRIKESPPHPLAQIGIERFLKRHWGRRPLLLRGALPGLRPPLTPAALWSLAARDDVDARLVSSFGGRWNMTGGPLLKRPRQARDWTVLVNGANLYSAAADRLLQRFAFVPYTRIDDLMVSYAVPGGGVGPHFDSYDVFLIQVAGRRRWRYGAQKNLTLRAGLPLKILEQFEPEYDVVLEPGDMLYLPPHVAHDGIALDECMTCSVGFRAPRVDEILREFLFEAADAAHGKGRIAEAVRRPTRHPAALSAELLGDVARTVAGIRFSESDVRRFTGRFFSEPKPSVVFDPVRALSAARFRSQAAGRGMRLDPRSRLLYAGREFYINGETVRVERRVRAALAAFADRRSVSGAGAAPLFEDDGFAAVLYEWYRAGWIQIGAQDERHE